MDSCLHYERILGLDESPSHKHEQRVQNKHPGLGEAQFQALVASH
jgi:hypothetical protein